MRIIKNIVVTLLILNSVWAVSAFDKGWVLGLRADFGGSLTLPSIPTEDLKKLNPLAETMTGQLSNMLIGGQASVGYIFDSTDLFPTVSSDSAFSGIGIHGYLGFGQGNASQKISALVSEGGDPLDIYMIVDYLPVISFGIKGEALFFDNRFSVGLGLGVKMIADFTPEYLMYSTEPSVIETEVGTIIVTEDMMTKMNAFMFSPKLELGYSIPILPTTELVLGFFTQFNLYKPKYLTVPPKLREMALAAGATAEQLDAPFPNYWLNSLEFGVNLGFMFRL